MIGMMLPPQIPDVPFTWAHVKESLPRHRLVELVRNRQVRRVLTGVYLRADVPDTLVNRARAAALVAERAERFAERIAELVSGPR